MICYRPFLNSDPPALVALWNSQPPNRGLVQPITVEQLEDLVLSKPFFERAGLILALEDNVPIGFAHAGFGPTPDHARLDCTSGTTAMLIVSPREDRAAIASELLSRSEEYLRECGASKLHGGGTPTLAPFYFGLYGGSSLPGVLATDHATVELFRAAGYVEASYCRCFRCDLTSFRPPVDREMMQARRQYQLEQVPDSPPRDWWEGCTCASEDERWRVQLCHKAEATPVAALSFRRMGLPAHGWSARSMGLVASEPAMINPALLTFFLGEGLRLLRSQGTTLVEIQAAESDPLLAEVCGRLGFEEIDHGSLFTKPA